MGDKTQLLLLILVTRFKKPWTILLGVLVATLANHALAAWLSIARSLTNTFSGILWTDVPAFIAAQVTGAVGAFVTSKLFGR